MKAFVFTPANKFVGKFDVPSPAEIARGFERFRTQSAVNPYDYIECSGETWTILPGNDGLELVEGCVNREQEETAHPSTEMSEVVDCLERIYYWVRLIGIIFLINTFLFIVFSLFALLGT